MRNLYANEIDVRVGQVGDGWATLLLYKDARIDMTLLDEEYGKLGWKREHFSIDGNLYCRVSVWDDQNKHWVDRSDVGVESNTEATKGQASDSFKRAGVNFGIGRELYTGPRVSINVDTVPDPYKQGKFKLAKFDTYSVSNIDYEDNDVISKLVIKNKSGSIVFTYPKHEKTSEVRDRKEEVNKIDTTLDVLTRAKKAINEQLEAHDYTRADQKRTFITMVLEKPTIDTLDDADAVMDALENEVAVNNEAYGVAEK